MILLQCRRSIMSVDYTNRALLKLIDCLFFQVDNRYILEVDNTNAEIIKQHKYIRTFIFYKECFFFLLDPLPPSGCLILSRSVTVKRRGTVITQYFPMKP